MVAGVVETCTYLFPVGWLDLWSTRACICVMNSSYCVLENLMTLGRVVSLLLKEETR